MIENGQISKDELGTYYSRIALDVNDNDLQELDKVIKVCSKMLDECKRIRLYMNTLYNLCWKDDKLDSNELFNLNLCVDGILIEISRMLEVGNRNNRFGIKLIREQTEHFKAVYNINENNQYIIVNNRGALNVANPGGLLLSIGEAVKYDNHIKVKLNKITNISRIFKNIGVQDIYYSCSELIDLLQNILSGIDKDDFKQSRCELQAHNGLNHLMSVNKNIQTSSVITGIARGEFIHNQYRYQDVDVIRKKSAEAVALIQQAIVTCLYILIGVYSRQVDANGMIRAVDADIVNNLAFLANESYSDGETYYCIKAVKEQRE